jgi:hypothetical protein
MNPRAERLRPQFETCCALVLTLVAGCGAETAEPIMGSGHVVENATDADVIERVAVSLPFEAEIGNGEPKKLVVRGEDNLLQRITIEEIAVGEWRISAPQDLAFTQHQPMQVAIPYVDMVELSIDGDDLVLKDHPTDFWHQNDPAEGNAGE